MNIKKSLFFLLIIILISLVYSKQFDYEELKKKSLANKIKYLIIHFFAKIEQYTLYYIMGIRSYNIDEPYDFIVRNTEEIVTEKIKEFSSYDLIITDLYHGMIFSVIANTPVVVLPSSDHKISSGVQFFKAASEFDKRVYFFENIERR